MSQKPCNRTVGSGPAASPVSSSMPDRPGLAAGVVLARFPKVRPPLPEQIARIYAVLLWSLGWRLTTGLEFRWRYGQDYGHLMRHEHVNTAGEIEEVLQLFFADIRVRVLGVSRSLSLYRFLECRNVARERVTDFLSETMCQPREAPRP